MHLPCNPLLTVLLMAKPFRSMDGAHFKKQTFTVCVNRISHRNWNRGCNGLPHFLCTILFTHTAYPLPVCTPICAHSKPQVSRVKSHFWGNQVTIGKWAVQGLKQPYFIEFTCYSAKARLIVPTGTIQNTVSKDYLCGGKLLAHHITYNGVLAIVCNLTLSNKSRTYRSSAWRSRPPPARRCRAVRRPCRRGRTGPSGAPSAQPRRSGAATPRRSRARSPPGTVWETRSRCC